MHALNIKCAVLLNHQQVDPVTNDATLLQALGWLLPPQ